MNPEIKTKWLAALRGGEYRQGDNVLMKQYGEDDKPAYCCLGVLCDIAVKEGLDIGVEPYPSGNDNNIQITEFDGAHEVLPHSVKTWAGLDDTNPEVTIYTDGEEETSSLAELNDNGATFAELADIIAENL